MRGAAKLLVLVLSTGVLSLTAYNSAADAQALKYCKADAARLCKGIKEGGGRIVYPRIVLTDRRQPGPRA